MKIKKLLMEDWLADYQSAKYNLSESGFVDFTLKEFLDLCGETPDHMKDINLMNPDTRGSLGLRQEILQCYQTPALENVLVTAGVTEALFAFFNVILAAGDEVIVQAPQFQTLAELPAAIGCQMKYIQLDESNGFLPEPTQITELITDKTKLIIINNPHNPTGSVLNDDQVREIGEIARKHDIFLLFDEHYKFLPLHEGTDMLTSGFDICGPLHGKVASVGSVTKCFGLNGIRVGWLLAPPDIIEECREFKHYLTHVTPPICDYLAERALKNKERLISYVKNCILTNLSNLNAFMERNHHRFNYIPPRGGLVCFPRLTNTTDATPFCQKMLETHKISLLPGNTFGMNPHFRLNIGIKPEPFSTALQLME